MRLGTKGCPTGLTGNNMPLSSRLNTVADAYDVLVNKRVCKAALPHKETISIIKQGSGTQFAPDFVAAITENVLHTTFCPTRTVSKVILDHQKNLWASLKRPNDLPYERLEYRSYSEAP